MKKAFTVFSSLLLAASSVAQSGKTVEMVMSDKDVQTLKTIEPTIKPEDKIYALSRDYIISADCPKDSGKSIKNAIFDDIRNAMSELLSRCTYPTTLLVKINIKVGNPLFRLAYWNQAREADVKCQYRGPSRYECFDTNVYLNPPMVQVTSSPAPK